MPFGPKRTAGISGHYSEAWTIAPRLGAEVKPVEAVEVVRKRVGDREGVWEGQERSGRPRESAEEAGRHGR